MFGRSGSAPAPFDALNGPRLAGPEGSHPLHDVRSEELVVPSTGGVVGHIVIDQPAVVGGGIEGTITLRAERAIQARAGRLRLVGLRLDEQRKSVEQRDKDGNVIHSERWVEAGGRLFVEDAFMEPAIPAVLEAGATWTGRFRIPAPRLGPPSAHLGESIVAWALEVRWDIPRAPDESIAVHLPIAQSPELLSAGVGRQGGPSLLQAVSIGDASVAVTSGLPARRGEDLGLAVRWPSAPGGQRARVELHRRTNAPNGVAGIIDSVALDSSGLTDGSVAVALRVPADAAPSFDGAGLEVRYIVRVLIDRRFRTDLAIERPVGIA